MVRLPFGYEAEGNRLEFRSSRRIFVAWLALAAIPSHASVRDWIKQQIKQPGAAALDPETVAAGLREALEKGTSRAVRELGRENGFWQHPSLRIPVPDRLQKADRVLRRLGQNKLADDFARSLNRAAEQATPVARDVFVDAIRRMTIRDALDILRGPQDAATQYFRREAGSPLAKAFRPIVEQSTAAVGVTAQYKRYLRKAEPLGIIDARDLDIDEYVTHKALDGLFQLVADEEQRIRADPAARTTELLRKVFR